MTASAHHSNSKKKVRHVQKRKMDTPLERDGLDCAGREWGPPPAVVGAVVAVVDAVVAVVDAVVAVDVAVAPFGR